MDISIEFADGDSKMTFRLTENGMQIRRPSRGLTPMLASLADALLDEEMIGDANEAAKAKDFVHDADNIHVLVGEERCG
jgi:hypothetical protein